MSVTKKALSGIAWNATTSIGARAVGLVGTLVLIRFVAPADYGVVQAASALVATATAFSALGIGIYVIKDPHASREVTFHATALHMLSGILALLIVWGFAEPLGPFFEAPTLGIFVPLLGLAALFERLTIIPERVLQRSLRFREASLARMVGELSYTVVSVWLAARGHGGWSIVWGNVVRSFVRMVLTLAPVPWRDWAEPHRLRWDVLATILRFGAVLAVGHAAGFAARRWDNLLVSHLFGPEVLGAYALAYNLADIPSIQVGEQITDVLMASLAHMAPDARRSALVRTVAMLALVMFPLAAGLASVAPALADAFLTHAWAGVGPMVAILSFMSVPRPVTMALNNYILICEGQVAMVVTECVNVVVLLGLIATLGSISPYAACFAVGSTFTVRMIVDMWLVRRIDGTPILSFLRPMLGPLLACLPMVGAVLGAHRLTEGIALPRLVRLLGETLLGAAVYAPAALLLAPSTSRELLRLIRRVRERPAAVE